MSQNPKLTPSDIEVRVWGFVVIVVTLILCFIVVALLYSVTFVTQPIKSMAPIDQAYTKMLNDIVLLIVGGIGGVMTKRVVNSATNALTPTQTYPQGGNANPCPQAPTFSGASPIVAGQPFGAMPVWVNPALDESWTPGPPPQTPSDHLHSEREDIAMERANARNET